MLCRSPSLFAIVSSSDRACCRDFRWPLTVVSMMEAFLTGTCMRIWLNDVVEFCYETSTVYEGVSYRNDFSPVYSFHSLPHGPNLSG